MYLGDGVNDAPSLKKADTGIAVQGATEAARLAADIVFLAPGLSAILAAIKTSRRIFSRMRAYVIYRIALSIHLEIFFATLIIILNPASEYSSLVVFVAIFADIATLAIAYDHATFDLKPVKWQLAKLWTLSTVLGVLLASFTWILLGTMLINTPNLSVNEAISLAGVIFLEIVLTENWLIFITRTSSNGDSRHVMEKIAPEIRSVKRKEELVNRTIPSENIDKKHNEPSNVYGTSEADNKGKVSYNPSKTLGSFSASSPVDHPDTPDPTTRSNKLRDVNIPSWQLVGAVLLVDLIATLFILFGWLIGDTTSIVIVVKIYIYAGLVMSVLFVTFFLLNKYINI